MQSTTIPKSKKLGIYKYFALASVGLFAIAALLISISFFNSSPILSNFTSTFIVLGVASLGLSFNIARCHNQPAAVQVLAKVTLIADIISTIMILLIIADVPSGLYSNCDYNCGDGICFQEYECLQNADNLAIVFIKVAGTAIILALAGEILGRYLAYKTTKKLTNFTRWSAIILTALLSLAIIIFLLFEIPYNNLIVNIAFCVCALYVLVVVVTPILLLVEKKYAQIPTKSSGRK